MASMTPANGVLKTPARPAAAPQAKSVRRSAGEDGINWLNSEPSAAPVWMIGPSAPKGPPLPTVMAALRGLKKLTRGLTMLAIIQRDRYCLRDAVALNLRSKITDEYAHKESAGRGRNGVHQWNAARLAGKFADVALP